MKEIRVEKVTLNIGAGTDKERLERSKKLLESLTKQKAVITNTRRRNTFGVAKGRPIGVKVTLRGNNAELFLAEVLKGVDKKVKMSQINGGNFSIGVKEYIDLPNAVYDPDVGIVGFDVSVTLERPGFRVKKRRLRKAKIGKTHLISKGETIAWMKDLGVEVVGA